ncbi:MAG TPA: methyltransferase domain-containing protein [Ktedonobacterales bacterium]|nr:methyltransferase domain-containing protein [Ktedonobacterales bacterium]
MSAPADPYAAIAEWYDVEHDAFTEDAECFTSLLAATHDQRASVLEIGSGTGRLAAALAIAGYDVTGVEPSAAMRTRMAVRLARLPERVARRIRVVAGDASVPSLPKESRFDAAILSMNTLAHLLTSQERHQALSILHDHLRPAGRLLVDLDPLGLRRLRDTAGQLWWLGTWPLFDGQSLLTHFVTGAPGPAAGIVEIVHFYDAQAPDGALRRTVARMPLALLSPGEVEVALLRAGFRVEAVYGGYDLVPYDDASPRILFDARRPEQ